MKDEVFATVNSSLIWFHEIAAFGLDGFAMSIESLAGAAYGAGNAGRLSPCHSPDDGGRDPAGHRMDGAVLGLWPCAG